MNTSDGYSIPLLATLLQRCNHYDRDYDHYDRDYDHYDRDYDHYDIYYDY